MKQNFDSVEGASNTSSSIGDLMRRDCIRVRHELRSLKNERSQKPVPHNRYDDDDLSLESSLSSASEGEIERVDRDGSKIDICAQMSSQGSVYSYDSSLVDNDFEKLSIGLQKRAENFNNGVSRESLSSNQSSFSQLDTQFDSDDQSHNDTGNTNKKVSKKRRRSSRDRNVNRQLNRLYKGRSFTAGLVFSKGHFLGDISKMVAGLLSSTYQGKDNVVLSGDDNSARYGFGEKNEGDYNPLGGRVGELTIHEQEGDQHIVHSSTLAAGKDGCVVLVFPKPSLILFLDEYPGLLLSLLGTQVVL